jgi:hypothetical protein
VEQAQANPVVAVILENLQARLGFTAILEDDATIFVLFEEREVGAYRIIRRMQTSRRADQ